jgi:membrane carboxypeptidase/penicillin-binding protein PbpC
VATEWFLPGTYPTDGCAWHRRGTVELPLEYAEWVAAVDGSADIPAGRAVAATLGAAGAGRTAPPPAGLRIVSPRDGDRYGVPPGTDPRYATIALRAVGAGSGEAVRWFVDGQAVAGARWTLVPGRHVVRATTRSGDRDEVRIEVR